MQEVLKVMDTSIFVPNIILITGIQTNDCRNNRYLRPLNRSGKLKMADIRW